MTAPASLVPRPASFSLAAGASRLLVSAYKLLGFVILTSILCGIAGFVGLRILYLAHHAWLAPTVVSPTDPGVLDLKGRIASEGWMRHKVLGERVALEVRLNRVRLISEIEQEFQSGFPAALGGDVSSGRESLETLSALRQQQRQLAGELARYEREIGERSLERLQRDRDARLIDQEQYLRETYQLSQMTQARIALGEKELELADRIRRLAREVEARDSARAPGNRPGTTSYEALLLRRERARSMAEGTNAKDEERALEHSMAETDRALAEYDALLGTLRSAPLLRAASQPASLGFVPYDNQPSVAEGSPVYACRLVVVGCRLVGHVSAYLPGEQLRSHPVFGHEQRGQLVELALSEPEWAKASVLHAGRPPLFL